MTQQQNRAAIYCRLSRDDGEGESMSIGNQRDMLSKYAKENGFTVYKVYQDDGYSGTNFDRPGFQQMIGDIEANKIDIVLVKDQSRIGREHLQTGYYIEMFFSEHNVRFIAVNDNVDTALGDNDFMGFRNIMNEFYAKDISKKIRSARRTLAYKGAYTASLAPYGYKKDPNDKHRLIVDENTAPTVKKIFKLASEGNTPYQISQYLEEHEILSPRVYLNKTYGIFEGSADTENPYIWYPVTVASILRNPVYLGYVVGQKTTSPSFKIKKRTFRPQEEWILVEAKHEALIDQETFDIVSKMVKVKKRPTVIGERQIFHGLVKCADCGASLTYSAQNHSYGVYTCGNYRSKGKRKCTAHYISAKNLYGIVESEINRLMEPLKVDVETFIEQVAANRLKALKHQCSQALKLQKQLKQRSEELHQICRKLYEDNALGKLSDDDYTQYSAVYLKERKEVDAKLEELDRLLAEQKAKTENIQKFAQIAGKYLDFKEMTKPMLNELIDKIVVHQCDKSTGKRIQKVEVYYRFIGLIE